MDQRARRIVDPVHILRLVVGGRKRFAALELVGEGQGPTIPERDVAEHGGHRPVLVHGDPKLVLAQALYQGTQALALSPVLLHVGPILGHRSITIPPTAYPRYGKRYH